MSGFRKNMQRLAVVPVLSIIVIASFMVGSPAHAQVHTQRRESNANRKARIERTIQDTYSHRWELFGGGGYLRFRSGEYLKRNNEITWAASGTYFLNPKLGITGDARGSFGNAKVGNTIYNIADPLITEYTLTGGVTYRLYMKQKFAVSATGLAGYTLGNFDGGSKAIPAPLLGMWSTSDRPVIIAGANVDYNFYPNLAFRITPTYVGTMFRGVNLTNGIPNGTSNGSIQNNLGVNAGIVYRFGRIK